MSTDYAADKAEAEAFAEMMGFAFYIVWGQLVTYAGWKSEDREATEQELEMWTRLGGPLLRNDR